MTDAVEIPEEFGGSWEAFLRDWLLGSAAIPYSAAEVSRGLLTLKRLWPQRFTWVVSQSRRGHWISVTAIHDGLLLEACEPAKHFWHVLDRLKHGQRSAYSEMVLVAGLRQLGYAPTFEAPDPGSPDAQCMVDGTTVNFEVHTPDPSYRTVEQQKLASELQAAVNCDVSKCPVEIEILDTFKSHQIPDAVNVIKSAPPLHGPRLMIGLA